MSVPYHRSALQVDRKLYAPTTDEDRSGRIIDNSYYFRMNYNQSSPKTVNYYVCFYEGDTPDKYKYERVLGSDKKIYKCKIPHTSSEDNRPVTKYDGSSNNYLEFWEEETTETSYSVWKEKTVYKTNWSLRASDTYFDANGKTKISGKEYTKSEIATLFKGYIDEFNTIGVGINFVYLDQKDVTDIKYIQSASESDNWGMAEYNKTRAGSILVTSAVGVAGSNSAGLASINYAHFAIKATIRSILLDNDEVIKHEMLHCLGFWHESSYTENNDKTKKYGNPNWSSSLLSVGFIRKNTGGWKATPYPTEDKVSFLDVLYRSTAYKKKIYGNVDGTKKIIYINSDGTSSTIATNKLYNGDVHSTAEAFLFDTHKKELQYRAPIDKNGYFEFKIRVVPPTDVGIRLLITTEHIARKFIYQQRETSTDAYSTFNGFENGYLYYGVKTIDLSGTDIQVTDITFTDKVESLKELELRLGCYLEYIGGGGDKVKGTNGKQYTCIDSHKSNNNNLPITGLHWKRKWRHEGTMGGSKWVKNHDYNSKYKNFQENNERLKAINSPGSKTYISEKDELCGL